MASNDFEQFEQRKRDHIEQALDPRNQASGLTGLSELRLLHDALPDLDFDTIDIHCTRLGVANRPPFLVSSMTAGHRDAININAVLAEACSVSGWAMGVGSQRRELDDPDAQQEWQALRRQYPKIELYGNIGLSQVITAPLDALKRLTDNLQASALIVHTNPLQECLQKEGTPQFKGGLAALTRLCAQLPVPVILKETGCGFSSQTLSRLLDSRLAAVDVSGLGGTHWGRIEGHRCDPHDKQAHAAKSFAHWGVSTVASLRAAVALQPPFEVWGSGGVRSGLEAATLLALGATTIGLAKPMLEAALEGGTEAVLTVMEQYAYEVKIALFCSGSQTLTQLRENHRWL